MGLDHGWRGPNIVRDGLVLYLDAGSPNSYQGSGTTWKDISKFYQNNGTLINGPTFNSDNGGSIVFDGVDDYVNLPHVLDVSATPITWDIWFKANNTTNGILFSDWTMNNWSFLLRLYNGTFTIGLRNSSNVDISDATISICPISTGVVYKITVSYEQIVGTLKTYVNGVLVNTKGANINPAAIRNSANNFSIGLKQDSATVLAGTVYQAQIYNRALSASEILQNYNATKGRFGL